MKAMILAAGVGSRLDPLTRAIPKPMVPIVNRPVIEHIVHDLKKHGFTEIRINLHYLGDVIQEYLGDGSKFGVKISYSQEDKLWGDAGSVKRSQDFFGSETFMVVGGDDISDINLSEVVAFHKSKKATSTITLTAVDDPSQFGIVITEEDGRISRFLEKPKGEDVFSNTANTGVYLFEPEVFDLIPADTFYGFGNDVFPQLLAAGKPLYGFLSDAFWKDVGNLQVYRQTNFEALAGKVALEFPMPEVRPGVWIGEGTNIDPSAEIGTPVAIGSHVTIGAGAKIGENTIIGDGSIIEAGCTLRETILWEGAHVSAGTQLERCVVGKNASVSSNVAIFDANIMDPARRMTAKH